MATMCGGKAEVSFLAVAGHISAPSHILHGRGRLRAQQCFWYCDNQRHTWPERYGRVALWFLKVTARGISDATTTCAAADGTTGKVHRGGSSGNSCGESGEIGRLLPPFLEAYEDRVEN